MRVPNPINPQSRVPQQQLGYQRAADYNITGLNSIADAVKRYADIENEREQKRQLFDVKKAILDETNSRQTDFEKRSLEAGPGAPNFVEHTMQDYTDHTTAVLQDFKTRKYSEEAQQKLAIGLASINNTYLQKAVAFKEYANKGKASSDILQ